MNITIAGLNNFIEGELNLLADKYNFSLTKGAHGVALKATRGVAVNRASCVIHRYYFDIEALGFVESIGYPIVDKIANPILVKYELLGSGVLLNDSNTFSPPFFPKNNLAEKIPIYQEKDLFPVIEKFKLFFVEDAMSYFEKWNDLSTVHQYLLEAQDDEVLLQTLGIFFHFKWATIMRLCGNPDYKPYAERYFKEQEGYYKEEPNDIQNIRYYNASKELLEALEKAKPIGEIRYEGR